MAALQRAVAFEENEWKQWHKDNVKKLKDRLKANTDLFNTTLNPNLTAAPPAANTSLLGTTMLNTTCVPNVFGMPQIVQPTCSKSIYYSRFNTYRY